MASIPQPGLTIQQVLQTVTPTIYSPTFPACIVGPCYQIIEMQSSDGSVNSSALLSLPPIISGGGTATYAISASAKSIYVEVDGTNREYTFTTVGTLPIATVCSKLNEAFSGYLYWDYFGTTIRVRTVSTGDSSSLMFRSGGATSAHTILGFNGFEDIRYYGSGDYENNPMVFPYKSLPDSRGIIDYLTFDETNINVARIWGGSIVTLSDESAINRNRYNRVGVTYDNGAGAGTYAANQESINYQGGKRFFGREGHVQPIGGGTAVPGGKELWLDTQLTGNEWDLDALPNNQLLWPVGTGSTSSRLLQTGRHAYTDIQLSADGVTTTAAYHFEAHGFQKFITDQSVTPGVGVGAFGNQIAVKFTETDVDGAGHGILADGNVTAPDQFTSVLGVAAGTVATGAYVYLEAGSGPGEAYNGWYILTGAGPVFTLTTLTGGAVTIISSVAADVGFTVAPGSYILPNVKNPVAGAAFPVEIEIEYCPAVCGAGGAAWTVAVPDICKAAALDTAMKANATIEPFLGPNTTVGSTNISYLDGSTSALLSDDLSGKIYGLNFGADPYNYAATSATQTYPTVLGECPLTAASFYGASSPLINKTITVRVNGGPVTSDTLDAADMTNEAGLLAALNALVTGGSPFTAEAAADIPYATEMYGSTSATLTTTSLVDASADVAALTYVEAARVGGATILAQITGDTVPRGSGTLGGTISTVSGINPATGTITLAASLGAGPYTVDYRLLTTGQKVLKCTLDATMCGNYAGYDAGIEFGGDAANMLFRGPYTTSTTDFTGKIFRGDPLRVQVGDKLYNAGSYVGTISAFANYTWNDGIVGAQTLTNAYLDLTEQNATVGTALGTWYISSQGITGAATDGQYQGNTTSDKPRSEVWFDTTNQLIYLKGGLNRDGGGVEYQSSTAQLAAGYTALRTDITAAGASPAVQIYSTYAEMETAIGPVNSSNPLALGVYLAMLNAPNIQVKAFGVEETSTLMAYGTTSAYAKAFDFLQSADVYAIAPMSDSPAVHELLDAHVTAMADPTTGKSERVCFVCEDSPTERTPTTCGSAPNTTAPFNKIAGTSFEVTIDAATGFNIAAVLAGKTDANGATVPISGAVTIENGLYITRTDDPFKYSVSEIKAGNVLKCRITGFSAGSGPGTTGNDDNFYATTMVEAGGDSPAWDADGETVTLYVRQASIDTTTSTGRAQLAAALASKATAYGYRRVRYVQPSSATYLESGSSTSIHGMYTCAALAGLCASTAPQQSFTGLTLAGIESVSGSWDLLSASDMDTAAGGGVWWLIQQDSYSAVETRHQLTTDVTSLQTREASITHVLDYITKRLRVSMQGLAGKFNLTRNFLDYVSILVSSVIGGMTGTIVSKITITNIYIDSQQPDTLYVDISVTPYYPANQINVTLVV